MKNLRNRVQLIGNLGKDPEIRNLENGKTVANFPMATSETYRNTSGKKSLIHNGTIWWLGEKPQRSLNNIYKKAVKWQ